MSCNSDRSIFISSKASTHSWVWALSMLGRLFVCRIWATLCRIHGGLGAVFPLQRDRILDCESGPEHDLGQSANFTRLLFCQPSLGDGRKKEITLLRLVREPYLLAGGVNRLKRR